MQFTPSIACAPVGQLRLKDYHEEKVPEALGFQCPGQMFQRVSFPQQGGLLCTRKWIQRRRTAHLMVVLSHGGTASPATRVEKWCCDHRAPNLTVAPGAEPKPNGPAFCPNTLPSAVPWLETISSPP